MAYFVAPDVKTYDNARNPPIKPATTGWHIIDQVEPTAWEKKLNPTPAATPKAVTKTILIMAPPLKSTITTKKNS